MTYQLAFHPKPTYLHVVVTGRNSRENVAGYVDDVMHESAALGSRWVLIEERLDGPRLRTIDVFDLAAEGASTRKTNPRLEAVAYVDVNADSDSMRFAETVAVNRGFPLKVFTAVADAERWLLREARRSTALR